MSAAYDKVVECLVKLIEEARDKNITLPWNKPWNPFRNSYKGGDDHSIRGYFYSRNAMNALMLRLARMVKGYNSTTWATFKEIQARGGSLKPGSKGIHVLGWFRPAGKRVNDAGEEKTEYASYMVPRAWCVFNMDCVEGIELPSFKEPVKPVLAEETAKTLAEFVKKLTTGWEAPPVVHDDGHRAFYKPALDVVNMPPAETFKSSDHYVATLGHEFVHSTGHASRLNRKTLTQAGPFGSENYSHEELVAEMGAAMLCGWLGIENESITNQSAAYLDNWLKVLKADPKMLAIAGQQALKAVKHITGEEAKEQQEEAAQEMAA